MSISVLKYNINSERRFIICLTFLLLMQEFSMLKMTLRFINTMEDHQKVLVFTINGENNIKSIFRIETSGIQKLLMQIGIPANLLGFSYIVTALELIALNPEYLNNITKGLYADVSEKCSSTPVRVERNIRHAIEIGFLKGNLEMIKKIFTSSNYSDKGAPTNSNFLAAIYYYMVNNEL